MEFSSLLQTVELQLGHTFNKFCDGKHFKSFDVHSRLPILDDDVVVLIRYKIESN